MKLRKINIHNYRPIKDCELPFEDPLGEVRPMTVLAGPNGVGKTSTLFAIVQALRGPMGYRTDDVPDPTDFDIHRSGGSNGLTTVQVRVSVKLSIQFDYREQAAIKTVLQDTQQLRPEFERALVIPDLRDGKIEVEWAYPPGRKPDGDPRPTWHVRTSPTNTLPLLWGRRYAIKGWNRRLLSDRGLLDLIGGICLFPQDRNLMSRVMGKGNSLPSLDAEEASDKAEDHEHVRASQRPVRDILKYLSDYAHGEPVEPVTEEETWEKRIQDNFRRICAPKEYLGIRYQQGGPQWDAWFRDGDSTYPLSLSASGEQVILEYLTRLTYPSPLNHSIILIDEPEIHLHPSWIRQLYYALPQMGNDNQFILTTHSPELRSLAASDGTLVDLGVLEESRV